MKKKYYYIFMSFIMIISSILDIINYKKVFNSQLDELVKAMPENSNFIDSIAKYGPISIIISSIICVIISIVLFVVASKGTLEKDRKKLISLSMILYLFATNKYVGLIMFIGLIISLTIKKVEEEKKNEKKVEKLPILEKHNTNIRDIIFGIGFILLYFSEIIWGRFIPKGLLMYASIFSDILLILIALMLYKDDKKRDFVELKNNFKAYIKYVFKKWVVMLGVALIIGLIIMIIFGNINESVNQELLKGLPLLYVLPSAIIMAPIVEETIFRIILRKIIKNDLIFIIVSALLFGLLHVTKEEGIINIIRQSLPYISMGAFLAHSYVKTNNSFISMMLHAFQNTFGCIFLIFS